MDQQKLFMMFPDIDAEELAALKHYTLNMTEPQQQQFLAMYQGRRKDRNQLLIFTILGFFGIAGIQRFIVGDIALGILYFFTGGLCLIGTIVDLININSMTSKFNQKQAAEVANIMYLMNQ